MEAKESESRGTKEADSVLSNLDTLKRINKSLNKKEGIFENVDVQSTSYALLHAAYVTLNASKKRLVDRSSVHTSCKNIIQYLLKTLPVAGENYLVVFKLIHDLCLGELSLSNSDISLLIGHVELSPKQDEEEEEGKETHDDDKGTASTESTTPTPLADEDEIKSKVDSKAEVNKLLKQLKFGKPSRLTRPIPVPSTPPPKKKNKRHVIRLPPFHQPGVGGSSQTWSPEAMNEEDSFILLCRDVMEELEVGGALLQFLWKLPVIQKLANGGDAFSQETTGGEGESEEVQSDIIFLIKNLHQLRNAVEATSLLLHTSHLLPHLTDTQLAILADILVGCTRAACQAIVAVSSMPAKKKEAAGGMGIPKAEKNREGEIVPLMAESISYEDLQVVSSVADLYGSLSYCATSIINTPTVVRALTSSIVSITLRVYQKLLTLQFSAVVQQNMRTLFIYHTFSSLKPLLSSARNMSVRSTAPEQAESGGMMKILGGVKLSVPMIEVLIQAVEGVRLIGEDIRGTRGKDVSSRPISISPSSLDVCSSNSSWQCLDMLLKYLPLLNDMFSLLVATFKKLQSHVLSIASSSQAEDSSHPLAKSHPSVDKHEHSLKLSLLEKISKFSRIVSDMGSTLGGDVEDEGEAYSPSPSSTVSSSGEMGGVYTLYSGTNSEDDKESFDEDYDDYELSPNFLMATLGLDYGDGTPSVPPPPPPPLPPRRITAREVRSRLPPRGIARINFGAGPKATVVETKKRKPILFLHLANTLMKCLHLGLVQNKDTDIQNYIREKIQAEHISCLAWLVQNLDVLMVTLDSSSKKDSYFSNELGNLGFDLMAMIREMIMNGTVGQQYLQGVLLNELGLNAKCWPLRITPAALSLLGCVLICRLGEGSGIGAKNSDGDDPLTVNIWKGFLHSLEESACSDEEPDEDLDVAHLQLMLFVWYTFSLETRSALFTSCAQSVIRAACAKKQGVPISPLIINRLLLVLDFLLFQFNERPPDLTDQVEMNLFHSSVIGLHPSSRQAGTPNSGKSPRGQTKIVCYPNELQLKYSTVLSKPNMASSILKDVSNPLKEMATHEDAEISPRFYNVRIPYIPCEQDDEGKEERDEEGEVDGQNLKIDAKVDEQACRLLLMLPIPADLTEEHEGKKGYDLLVNSLVSLMSVGMDYGNQNRKLPERILVAFTAHQCFNLSMGMLGKLPPSYQVLSSVVVGEGLSLLTPEGSCFLIHLLHLCMKFRMQHMDTEDILDTLLVSGYGAEEAEEMVARVISVMDSPEHFEEQTVAILGELVESDDRTMLPLVSIIALDLLLCLITRAAVSANEVLGGEEPDGINDASQPKKNIESVQMEKFELEFCTQLAPLLIKLSQKLLQYAHLYVTSSFSPDVAPYTTTSISAPREALDVLLSLSGKNLIFPKDKPLFVAHLPEDMLERLKVWEAALVIDPVQKKRLSSYDDEQGGSCMVNFLDCHLSAFGGTRTFDPSRSLKSTIISVLILMDYMSNSDLSEAVMSSQLLWSLTMGIIPLSCDVMMGFAQSHLMRFATNAKEFSYSCTRYKVSQCMKVLQLPEMQESDLLGTILADLFHLMHSMLVDMSEDDKLFEFVLCEEEMTCIDLLLLAALPSTSGEAMAEGLQFLISVLTQAEKSPNKAQDLSRLISQISSFGGLSPDKLTKWLRRVVLGSAVDGSSDVRRNTSLLRKFIELLTKPDCKVDPVVGPVLLTSLLPLGSELVSTLTPSHNTSLCSIFRDFFDCLILLAGTNKNDGHLQLVQTAVKWIPDFIQLMSTSESGEDKVESQFTDRDREDADKSGKEELCSETYIKDKTEELYIPVISLFLYLSRLTTAVQFSSNVVKYSKKRGYAGEEDPLFDKDEEGDENDEMGGVMSGNGADEEESAVDESDGEDLNNKLCTFALTQREFANQHWYHCHTCRLVNGSGACTICAKVCHKGHDVTYSKLGSFFCDCGSKKNGNCKALVKRSGAAGESPGTPQPPPFSDPPPGHSGGRGGKRRRRQKKEQSKKKSAKEGDKKTTATSKELVQPLKRRSSFPSLPILKLAQHIENYKAELKDYIDTSGIAQHSLALLHRTLPSVVRGVDVATSSGCSQARKAMIQLHFSDKKTEYTDSLMAATLGSQEGSFENVRLNFSENQGAMMRQLLASNYITRVAMCALTSIKGKRQHLCVNHDKGKLTILQLFPILKQADSNRRKLTLTRLSTTSVPFTVLSMTHNPCNEDLLVVCGLTECQLLVINSSGQVTSRSLLHPSVGNMGYIVKALWIPGSQYELVLISDTFVKIYDTHIDVICPTYYFVLDKGKIKDATVAVSEEGKFVIIMTSTGKIFSQPIVPSVTANEGPVYFTLNLTVTHPSIKMGAEGSVNGGGASVYYSQTLKMLFFSYFNGTSCIATTDPSFSEAIKIFDVILKSSPPVTPGSKTPGPALIYWMEVQHHPGLVCAISKATSNPVTLLIKPEVIQVHELKALPNKAKVQGMVAMRQPPTTGELVPLRRTTLIILCEDGSLRIYVANTSSSTEFWLQPQFQPTSPLAVLRTRPQKKGQVVAKKMEPLKFPIDFFEHCQLSSDVEFLGNDILHVYNKQQVLHRLNSTGLYIANTKPGGFSVEVNNLQSSTTAVVGVRVLLRGHSMEKSPSFVEILGRTHNINFSSGAGRWVDIPLTREESIQADKGFKINFGPSLDPSGINFVDTIQIYVKSKESFMWPEHTPLPAPATKTPHDGPSPTAQGDGEQGSEVMPMVLNKDCSVVDSLVCNALMVLSNHFNSINQEKWPEVTELVSMGMNLLMYSVPFQLQYHYKFLLSSLASSNELYHRDKDLLQLSHVVQRLSKRPMMEPEYFQYLLLMLITIGKSRPHNLLLINDLVDGQLADEVLNRQEIGPKLESYDIKEDGGNKQDSVVKCSKMKRLSAFIHLLNDLFWKIFIKRPANPAVAPVVNPGFVAVDLTVACITEVMWLFVILDHTLLDVVLKYSIKFLLAPDSHLCLSCSRVIIQLLKPKKEKVLVVDSTKDKTSSGAGPVVVEVPTNEGVEDRGTAGDEEGEAVNEADGDREEEKIEEDEVQSEREPRAQEWQELNMEPQVDVQGVDQLLANPDQWLAMQDALPDEETMMNLAIAVSLHNEGVWHEVAGQESIQAYLQEMIGGGSGGGVPVASGEGNIPLPPPRSNEQASSDTPQPEPPQTPPPPSLSQPQVEEMEVEERSNSSSPSSLFSLPQDDDSHLLSQLQGVLREGTATPSDLQPGQNAGTHERGGGDVEGDNDETKENQRDRGEGKTPDNQADMNSEPEIANDSSLEEDSSEDGQTLMENLSLKLEESVVENPPEVMRPGEDLNHRLASLQKIVLSRLVQHVNVTEEVGGIRSMCYLQLMMFLTSNLECCREDAEVLVSTLRTLLHRLKLGQDDVLEQEAVNGLVERSKQREVFLLYLRFFNILMSRRKLKGDDNKVSYSSHMLWFLTARILLYESNIMDFSRNMLSAIMSHQRCLEVAEDSTGSASPSFINPLDDLSPFFQKQYVKGHASDVFSAYGRLIAEILLVLPCQLKKTSEVTNKLPVLDFGPEWTETLCEFLLKVAQTTGVGRRHVRKLLLQICGSKENYRQTRDIHAARNYMKSIVDKCEGAGFDIESNSGAPLNLGYKAMLSMIEQLKACSEVAATRTCNWQAYCQKEQKTLPYLFQILFVLDEGLAPLILQLIFSALSGTPPIKEEVSTPEPESKSHASSRSARRKELEEHRKSKEKSKEKETKVSIVVPNKELCKALVHMFLSSVDTHSLARFSELFLLQANSSPLRWQAHRLLHCLYQYSTTAEQVSLVEMLWRLWPSMPDHGHKAAQFVDLLGYLTISTPQVLQKASLCQQFVERAVSLLKKQNILLGSHPNSHIYSQLRSLVDFDGFYLESEPCLVCNDPEIQSSMLKLQSVKSEIRYTPNMILVKLVGSHSISQILLRISEIKRTKMVRTINVYYSNRTVQNVIELKNKRSMWLMAKTCNLTAGQNEVKIDFPLPIVACNIIIQFSDFYDNLQGGSEMLQCPRCQATVPAHPGVCGTCGENVYQCHKCRAINYDEKDPFLCNTCGFSKYAKFDIFLEGKSCSAVDPIESEEDRQKTLSSINQLLEKADKIYKQQVNHRNELDQLLVCLASGATFHARNWSSLSSDMGVNKGIQLVAQRYCVECKTIYAELSKIIQNVLASRKELVKYDTHKGEGGNHEEEHDDSPHVTSPLLSPSQAQFVKPTSPPATPLLSSQPLHHQGRCYGCSSAATEHCITLLKALTFQTNTRRPLVEEKLIRELVEVNLRSGSAQLQRDIRKLLCQLTRDDVGATAELNDLIYSRIMDRLKSNHVDPNLASLVRPEMLLLMASLDMEDSCWEQRLKTVVRLFRKSQSYTCPAVMAGITMPCLKIMHTLIYPRDSKKSPKANVSLPSDRISMRVSDWLAGNPRASFDSWKLKSCQKTMELRSMEKEKLHQFRLMEKYAGIWRTKTKKVMQFRSSLRQASWLRSMLFNPASQSARRSTCNMIASLSQGEARQRQILDLLCGFLDDVGSAGEHAQEFLELLKSLIEDSNGKWKSYLAMRGILPQIGALITREIDHLQHLEETTLSSDLSQGYALKMLTTLLQSFLSIDSIKQLFKGKLVGMVLNGYLSLKRLVVQRTKRVDESQSLLLEMLEDLTSGTEEERQAFMSSCVETLNRFKQVDLITPIFIFERLCNIVHPEENDVGEFYLSLDKDPQQEEFLQGRMQGNPYPSSSPGLGPLMRDVKNKICTDCELVALLEDDTGMELLVCNKIISLDLPVKEVFKKIWCAQQNNQNNPDCMRVIYRMRGLLGDATEDMIEHLDNGKDKDTNEEEDYKMAAILSKCGGLDAILSRLSHIKDFVQGHPLISAALKLLGYCVKLNVNRRYLLNPHLNTLNVLLGTLDQALHYEERSGNGIGASVAESVLGVTERILQEASSSWQILVRTTSQEGFSNSVEAEGGDQLQVFLKHIESPFVQSNPTLREGLMHIIPFLTFGVTSHMNVLLQHFAPYLDFEKFDTERSPENRLYLDCFCVVASGIGKDASGEKMKDLAIEMNITPSAVAYLKKKVPLKSSSFDTPEWNSCIIQPSLPYVLKMLTGLSHWHSKTQDALLSVVGELHLLEQVASDQHIGTLAENLLEAMMENEICQEEIKRVRRTTRQEKKKRAMAMRAKELGSLGMQVNEKGQVIVAKSSSLVKEIETELLEEVGIKCCICLEGYRNQPNKILGIYTYTRKVTLDEFENKPKKTKGYATVSHFNIVHYECHSSAVTLARSRDEWESAMLQNANTKCNGLLPVWGSEITESNFSSSLARHNNFIQECTGLFDHSFHITAHDLRLLLLRFAYEKSFSAESGGGGPQSNFYLIPYLMHVALYVMNTTRCFQHVEKNLDNLLAATPDKWVALSYELDGPQYVLVQSLFVHSLSQWKDHRINFLRSLLVLAHARSISSAPIKSLPSSELAEFTVYKPLLILYGLVDGLQMVLKGTLKDSVKGEEVPSAVLDYIRNNDVAIMEGCDKVLALYQEKLLAVDSFESFCQVVGLDTIPNKENFIAELISPLV